MEIAARVGEAAADAIISFKEADEKLLRTQVRDHPDCPGNKARLVFWSECGYRLFSG